MHTGFGMSDKRLQRNPYGAFNPLTATRSQEQRPFSFLCLAIVASLPAVALLLFFAVRTAITTFAWLPVIGAAACFAVLVHFSAITGMPRRFFSLIIVLTCALQLFFVPSVVHTIWVVLAALILIAMRQSVTRSREDYTHIRPAQIVYTHMSYVAATLAVLIAAQVSGTLHSFSSQEFAGYVDGRSSDISAEETLLERSLAIIDEHGFPRDNEEIYLFLRDVRDHGGPLHDSDREQGGLPTLSPEEIRGMSEALLSSSLRDVLDASPSSRGTLIIAATLIIGLIVYTTAMFLARPLGWIVAFAFTLCRQLRLIRVERVQKPVEVIRL